MKNSAAMFSSNAPSRRIENPINRWRARICIIVMGIGFSGVVLGAFHRQIWSSEFYAGKGEELHSKVATIFPTRGKITDRHGKILAASTTVYLVYAVIDYENSKVKDIFDNSSEKLEKLASLLKLSSAEFTAILKQARQKKSDYVEIKHNVSAKIWQEIRAIGLRGVGASVEFERVYPEADDYAQIVGLLNIEDKGVEGLEYLFNAELSGTPGIQKILRNRLGEQIGEPTILSEVRDGEIIELTLDSTVQHFAFERLEQTVKNNKAKQGSLILMNAKTGEIYALVNYPSFNPNKRATINPSYIANRAITDAFEPGSTFKSFSIAAALEEKIVSPQTKVVVGNGKLDIGAGYQISDSHAPKSELTVEEVLAISSNVGAALIAKQMPTQAFWQILDRLEFGRKPSIEYPALASGKLKAASKIRNIEKITMSYGYGISSSLLQLAQAYTVFANKGYLVRAHLLKSADGNTASSSKVLSEEVANVVLAMLQKAAGKDGTGSRSQTAHYTVAGKTGTAKKFINQSYQNNKAKSKYRALFVGIAPASNPLVVAAVMIDEPSAGKYYGGEVAAPLFSDVVQFALQSFGVPPDTNYRLPEVYSSIPEDEL